MKDIKALFLKRKTGHGMWSAILYTRKTTSGCCLGTNNNNCQRYSSVCTTKQKQDASRLEKGCGQGKQQQKPPKSLLALKNDNNSNERSTGSIRTQCAKPGHNRNKGRKVRTFGNNSNKPKAGIALCRRDWIIVLNTRRSQPV